MSEQISLDADKPKFRVGDQVTRISRSGEPLDTEPLIVRKVFWYAYAWFYQFENLAGHSVNECCLAPFIFGVKMCRQFKHT